MSNIASEFGKFRRWGSSKSKVKVNPSYDHLALLLTYSQKVARRHLVAPTLLLEPCQLKISDICNDCCKLELQKHFDNNFEEIDRWGFVVAKVGTKYHSLGPSSSEHRVWLLMARRDGEFACRMGFMEVEKESCGESTIKTAKRKIRLV